MIKKILKGWICLFVAIVGIICIAGAVLPDKPKTKEDRLEEKLNVAAALQEMEEYGENLFPYGFEIKVFSGEVEKVALDENTWELKYKVEITNEYNAKYETCLYSKVTGTTEAPEILDWQLL